MSPFSDVKFDLLILVLNKCFAHSKRDVWLVNNR